MNRKISVSSSVRKTPNTATITIAVLEPTAAITLNAIDLNSGKYLWKVPLGNYPELAAKGKLDFADIDVNEETGTVTLRATVAPNQPAVDLSWSGSGGCSATGKVASSTPSMPRPAQGFGKSRLAMPRMWPGTGASGPAKWSATRACCLAAASLMTMASCSPRPGLETLSPSTRPMAARSGKRGPAGRCAVPRRSAMARSM